VEHVLAGRKPTAQDLDRLPYTHMVFEESMRLYPPAWILGRKAIDGDVIGGFDVPAGTIVAISPYTVHRHPDFWDDPEEFRPERFASRSSAQHHGFAYIPFGGGQRTCIGNHLAQIEAQLIIAMVVQSFSVALVPDQTVKPEPLFILRPTPPVYCQVSLNQ
jgi:cytochrome P450